MWLARSAAALKTAADGQERFSSINRVKLSSGLREVAIVNDLRSNLIATTINLILGGGGGMPLT